MLYNPIVIKSDSAGNLTLLSSTPIYRSSSNKNIIYLYSPFSVANNVNIGFTLNNGIETSTYPAFISTVDEDSIIEVADQVADYNIREFLMPSAITNQVSQLASVTTIMGFVEQELVSDDDYLGYIISDGVDVDGDLDAAYATPAVGNWANVWNSLNNTYYSYLVTSITPTVWANQSDILNDFSIGTSGAIGLAINKGIATNDDDIDVTVTQLVLAELAEQRQLITALTGDVSTLMEIADYDTEGTATKSVKYARNLGTDGASISYAIQLAKNALLDQAVLTTSDVVFNSVDTPLVITDKVDFGTREITDNPTDNTLDVTLNANVTGQMFQEELTNVINNSGANITNGQLVYISGSSGVTAEIELASNAVKAKAKSTIGMATEDIADGAEGFVTRGGLVRGLNTVAYTAGQTLYLGVDGAYTDVKPTPPTFLVEIGIVIKSGGLGVGSILINIEKIHEIAEAPDVFNVTPSEGDVLIYDAINEYYKAYDLPTALTTIDTKIDNLELDDLADVTAPSPMLGEVLQWNGVEWVNGDVSTQGAGKSVTYYIEDVASDIGGYEVLSEVPLGLTEELDTATLTPINTDILIGAYASTALGRIKIEAGVWRFESYAKISVSSGVSLLKVKVYKRASGGTETLLFETVTEEINNTVVQDFVITSVQAEFTILATDRLVVKYYGTTTSPSSPVITLYHSGNDNATHIDTPLQTLHNDLAGLQGGSSTERYHNTLAQVTELQALITDGTRAEAAANTLIKVDKDLTNNTNYVPLISSNADGLEVAYLYDVTNDTYRKMSLDEIAAFANTATGSFVASADYTGDGLGANFASYVKLHTLLLNANGYQVYADVANPTTGQMAWVLMPTMTETTALEMSLDNQTTYYDVLVNGGNVPANSLSGKLIKLYYNGTNWIYEGAMPIESVQSSQERTVSTFGTINPINGSPEIELSGLTANQLLIDGDDFATSWSLANATGSVTDGVYSFTATATNGRLDQDVVLAPSTEYLVIAKVLADSASVRLVSTDDTNYTSIIVAHSGSGNYEILSGTFTTSATVDNTKTRVEVRDSRTSAWTQNDVDNYYVIPVSSLPTAYQSYSASKLANIFDTYFEQSLDVVNPVIPFTGVNLFDTFNLTKEINTIYYRQYFLINCKPNQDYQISLTLNEDTVLIRDYSHIPTNTEDFLSQEFFISSAVGNKTFTSSNVARYIAVILQTETDYANINLWQNVQLEEGTTATAYKAYNSDTITFASTIRSVGNVQDKIVLKNQNWYKQSYVGIDTAVAIGATINSTLLPLINLTGIFTATDNTTGEIQTGVYGDVLTLTNISTVHYDLAEITEAEIEATGAMICEEVTTVSQSQDLPADLSVNYPLNGSKQIETLVKNVGYLQDEVDDLEVDVASNATDIATNATNIATNVTDINSVEIDVLTKAPTEDLYKYYVISTASYAENLPSDLDFTYSTGFRVVANNVLSPVGTNGFGTVAPSTTTYADFGGTSGDWTFTTSTTITTNKMRMFKLVSDAVSITTVTVLYTPYQSVKIPNRVLLTSGSNVVSSATARPAPNIILTTSYKQFDELEVYWRKSISGDVVYKQVIQYPSSGLIDALLSFDTDVTASGFQTYKFFLYNDTETTMTAYFARVIGTTTTPTITNTAQTGTYITKIIGVTN